MKDSGKQSLDHVLVRQIPAGREKRFASPK